MVSEGLDGQSEELDRLLTALIKRYQFRNRNRICCEDVTVSQCYVLKELAEHGTLAATRLSGLMHLSLSSLTRVVDELEAKGYVARRRLPADRRVIHVEMTPAGKTALKRMEGKIRKSEREVLEQMAPAERAALLEGLRRLNAAIDACGSWVNECST